MHQASRAATLAILAVCLGLSPAVPAEVNLPTSAADLGANASRSSFMADMRSGIAQLSAWAVERPDLEGKRLKAYLEGRLRDTSVEVVAGYMPYLLDAPPAAAPDLTMLGASPVPGVESSGYGWRDDPFHGRRKFHSGTDYRADRGTPVFAAGSGRVVFAGRQHGYGKAILIDHGNGLLTRYGHLHRIEVEEGAEVAAATKIGQVGSTGRATGPHLHFEVRLEGRPVDPVFAMRLGRFQRTAPDLARVLAYGLRPDVQRVSRDSHDRTNRRLAGRPERSDRAPRDRNLW
jgi:murein DD-endopeptidase MepM/ murein hydrolase activator NlpD